MTMVETGEVENSATKKAMAVITASLRKEPVSAQA